MAETPKQRIDGQKAGNLVKAAAEDFNAAVRETYSRQFVSANIILHQGLLAVQSMGQGRYFQKPAESLAERDALVQAVADAIASVPQIEVISESLREKLRLSQARAAMLAYEEAKRNG